MRWSTEVEEKPDVVSKDFLVRNRHRIMDIDKFLPLSFLDNPRSLQLFRLRRLNMTLAKEAGLVDLADETVLDNLADYNTSRGTRGNFQLSLITQRREWKDQTSDDARKGFWRNVLHGKKEEDRMESMEGGGY